MWYSVVRYLCLSIRFGVRIIVSVKHSLASSQILARSSFCTDLYLSVRWFVTLQNLFNHSTRLWHLASALQLSERPSLNWNGFMQQCTYGSHSPVAKVDMHPLIGMNPEETCIYSTLLFVHRQAQQMKLPVTCITFDQTLWLKAGCRHMSWHWSGHSMPAGWFSPANELPWLHRTCYGWIWTRDVLVELWSQYCTSHA